MVTLAAAAMLASGCRKEKPPEPKAATILWHSIGSWSGRGDAQTESFDVGYEPCRVRWQAKNESQPGAGALRVTLNSAVSGRELQVIVDQQGAGQNTAYVHVDPHYSYLVIESKNVDWSVTVEEGDVFSGAK